MTAIISKIQKTSPLTGKNTKKNTGKNRSLKSAVQASSNTQSLAEIAVGEPSTQ